MTDNQDSKIGDAVQPPTDRPLTAGDVRYAEGHLDMTHAPSLGAFIGKSLASHVSGNRMPAMSGDNRERIPAHIRERFDRDCESTAKYILDHLFRPATSAASEGDKLPDGAISGTDDGQTVWLESSTGGAHALGVWGGLSLRFEEADGTHTIRDYVDSALASPPAREEAPAEQTALAALRNRTSEPEAGAVAGFDPSLSNEANYERFKAHVERLIATHPAPATADKLRAVVEGFVSDLTGGHPNARKTRLVISHDALSARIDQALAALNEQPQ